MTIPQQKALSDYVKCCVGTLYVLSISDIVVGLPLDLFTATGVLTATMITRDLGKKINELEEEHFKGLTQNCVKNELETESR